MNILYAFGIGILRIFQTFLNKQTSGYMNSTKMYLRFGLYFESVASFFALVYLLIEGFYGFNLSTVVCAAITGALFLLELLSSLYVLQCAPLALCTMCSLGGGIILPAISGIFFFDEPIHLLGWLGIALFFVSAYILAPVSNKKVRPQAGTVFILFCNFTVNGFCGIVGKYFAVKVENGNAAMFACLCYAFAAFFFGAVLLASRQREENNSRSVSPFPKKLFLSGTAVGVVCATIVYFSTVLNRIISIVVLNTVPNAVCLVGSLVLGVLLFKEKLTLKKCMGIIIGILSTTVIVLT